MPINMPNNKLNIGGSNVWTSPDSKRYGWQRGNDRVHVEDTDDYGRVVSINGKYYNSNPDRQVYYYDENGKFNMSEPMANIPYHIKTDLDVLDYKTGKPSSMSPVSEETRRSLAWPPISEPSGIRTRSYDNGGYLSDPRSINYRDSQVITPPKSTSRESDQWMPSRPSVPYGQSPYRSLAPNEGFPSPQTEYRTLPDTGRQTGYMVPVPQEFVPSTPPSRVAPLDRNYLNPEPKKFDDGGEISRRYALDVLRATGSSNPESRKEYRALKKDARANGLSGQDMRLAARQGAIDRGIARIMPALSDEIIIEDEPIDLPAVDLNLEIPTDLGVDIKSLDDYIDMSGMSFNKAFGKARGYGLKEFIWNGKRYNTKLASPKPKPQSKPDSGRIIVSDTPSYPVYIPNNKRSFWENVKAAIINNAPYMK